MRQSTHDDWKLKNLLQSTLKMENEWLREEQKQSREQFDEEAQRKADRVASLEKFYHDQISMVQERIRNVQEERVASARAQELNTQQLLRELEAERMMGLEKLVGWFRGAMPEVDTWTTLSRAWSI